MPDSHDLSWGRPAPARGAAHGTAAGQGYWGGGKAPVTVRLVLLYAILGSLGACVATPAPRNFTSPCEEGVLKPCDCEDGSQSTQTCSGGVYQDCACDGDAGSRTDGTAQPDASPRTDAASPADTASGGDAAAPSDTTADAASDAGGSSGTLACQSDKDCKDAGKVCDPLTKVCVACLTDAECAPSQHCVGLSCQGYTSCTNSLGCKAAKGPDGKDQPICDQAIGECSACLTAADCPASHDCKGKQCIPFKTCQNSTECAKDEVCDKLSSRCVQCLGDNDCAANQLCEQGKCNAFMPCSSDKQCTDKGFLCDQAKGKCAQCLANSDCPGIYNCQNVGVAKTGLCVLDVCAQGQGACSNNAKVTCNSVGDGYGSPESCPSQTTCVAPGGKPVCKAWACTPGASCLGDKAVECSSDGLEVVKTTDCAASAQKCLSGQCKSLVCEPAAQYCDGNTVKQCAIDGLSGSVVKPCAAAEYCQSGQCKPMVCNPGQPACDGNKATQCNDTGSGYAGSAVDCTAKGQVCSAGGCADLKCNPQTPLYCEGNLVKQCDATGMVSTPLQTCGGGQYCDKGVCQAQVCVPNQLGCNGSVKATCNANGSGYLGGGEDCKASGKTCNGGQCISSFASCKAALQANPAAQDGVYPIDPDGAGPIAAANLFCDMKNGGLTLVGNYYDSAGDDMPNTTDFVVSGWQQTASGKWDAKASTVDRAWGGGTGSSAVSLAFVEALGKAAGQKNLKICLLAEGGADASCRQSNDGSLGLVSATTANAALNVYSSDKLTYTFARLGGLLGSTAGYNKYTYKGYCVPATPSYVSWGVGEGAFGSGDGCGKGDGLCELPKDDISGASIGAAWHGYCGGAQYRPNGPGLNWAATPWPDTEFVSLFSNFKGFRLYIGP